jgi:hypothetical protein
METNDKSNKTAGLEKKLIEKPLMPPAPPRTFTLIDPRDHFIGIALGKIIENQLTAGKWEHDVAASHAVRFADAVMRKRGTVSQQTISYSGRPFVPQSIERVPVQEGGEIVPEVPDLVPVQPPMIVQPPARAAALIPGTIPATISERLGEQPPLTEVK